MPKYLLILIFLCSLPLAAAPSKPELREQHFSSQRRWPLSKIPSHGLNRALSHRNLMLARKPGKAMLQAMQPEWNCIGPFRIGGRVRSVACHPTDPDIVYIGSAAGGIWKTTNAGQAWQPLFDHAASLAFGSVAIDPLNPDILYAATGEMSVNVDAYNGAGIFKSTDAGQSWRLSGLPDVGAFSKIMVHPADSKLIFAAATKSGRGFYRSTDAGETWSKTDSLDYNITDLSLDPTHPENIMIGINSLGIYYSQDSGASFSPKNEGLPIGLGRVSVQMAPSAPDTVYALMEVDGIGQIFKSTDRGNNWLRVFKGMVDFFGTSYQGFYNNYISVHPENPNMALAGGIDIWRTTSGGEHWINTTFAYSTAPLAHPDQHHVCFCPTSPNIIYAGHDGGMSRSANTGEFWNTINNDLYITQFYSLALDHSSPNTTYGGSQDNGTLGSGDGAPWRTIAESDGFQVVVSHADPDIIYGEYPNGRLWKRNLSTQSFHYIDNTIPDSEYQLWNTPLVMAPDDDQVLYHGRYIIYNTTNGGALWKPISPEFDEQFSAVAVSPANSDVLWAGTEFGRLIVSKSGKYDDWTEVSANGLTGRFITDIACHPDNPAVAYVSFSGYMTSHVFKTTDYGQSWFDISASLPDIPVNAIAFHPDNSDWLYIGTDIGVFCSHNDGGLWLPFGRNLPNTPVVDMEFHSEALAANVYTLRIATHGRSMWECAVPAEHISEPEICSPAGGETLQSGSLNTISWFGFQLPVRVEFSEDGGKTWEILDEECNTNTYVFSVPDINSLQCHIRISSLSDNSQSLISYPFSVLLSGPGAIISSAVMDYIVYGLDYDAQGRLWTNDYYNSRLVEIDPQTFREIRYIDIPGDSLSTGFTIDRSTGNFYLHKANSEYGEVPGGIIQVLDSNGIELRKFSSPAANYPVGIAYVDGTLLVMDRDQQCWIYKLNPATGQIIDQQQNAFVKSYGPRGLCRGEKYLYETFTSYGYDNTLEGAYIIKMERGAETTEKARLNIDGPSGIINVRGIALDDSTGDFLVSDFEGRKSRIYRIAGFDGHISVAGQEPVTRLSLWPNPASEFVRVISGTATAPASIIITDINGRIVLSENLAPGQSVSIINTEGLAPGIYIVSLKQSGRLTGRAMLSVIR